MPALKEMSLKPYQIQLEQSHVVQAIYWENTGTIQCNNSSAKTYLACLAKWIYKQILWTGITYFQIAVTSV